MKLFQKITKKLFIYFSLLLLATVAVSCGDKSGSKDQKSNGDTEEENGLGPPGDIAICMWEELSVKEAPEGKGKFLTTIFLGEIVRFLNETKVDESSERLGCLLTNEQ